jgi:hypothetical protein
MRTDLARRKLGGVFFEKLDYAAGPRKFCPSGALGENGFGLSADAGRF